MSQVDVSIPELVSTLRSSESTVCIHCNSKVTNWSIVKIVFLNELKLSSGNDKILCYSFQFFEIHGSIGKHTLSFFVIIILESKTTCVKRAINNSKTKVGVVTNHMKLTAGSD